MFLGHTMLKTCSSTAERPKGVNRSPFEHLVGSNPTKSYYISIE